MAGDKEGTRMARTIGKRERERETEKGHGEKGHIDIMYKGGVAGKLARNFELASLPSGG